MGSFKSIFALIVVLAVLVIGGMIYLMKNQKAPESGVPAAQTTAAQPPAAEPPPAGQPPAAEQPPAATPPPAAAPAPAPTTQ